jgi:kynurenine formamidase
MCPHDESLTFEPLLMRDGFQVSRSPWGPDDEIGRLNWVTPDSTRTVLEHLDGRHMFDLNVDYFVGMPCWTAAGDPAYSINMTHTPRGSMNDGLTRVRPDVHERYAYCGDAIHMYTHCGTHIDTLNHFGYYGTFWNGWTMDRDLGSRCWTKGGPNKFPPVIARGVLLDVAGMKGVDCLPDGYGITPQDLQDTIKHQGVELRRRDIVLVRTGRMTLWPDFDRYGDNSPGITVRSARWLCEEAGAMCIAGDCVGLETHAWEEEDAWLPVHSYMFATAGAQIMEIVNMEEIAAERQYEFAFLGFPLRLRGATGAPMSAFAVPLRD